MAIIVPILTQFDDKGIKAAVREFERAKTSIDKFGAVGKIFGEVGQGLTKNVTVPIIAMGGALALMVRGAVDAEAAQSRLRKILLTTAGATDAGVDALIRQAEALEKVGVASKDSILIAQSQLATFDLQASTISKLTPAILDYVLAEKGASATADDFKSMTNGLAQALNGQFSSLTRIGFVLDEETKKKIKSGTESERAAALVEVLNSTYKGFNETLLNTPEGQLVKLQTEFKNVKDEIGVALLPIMMDFIGVIRADIIPLVQKAADNVKNLVQRFSALDDETKKQILTIIGLVAAFGPMLIVVGKIIESIKTFYAVFKALSLALLTNPIYLVVAGLVLLGIAIYKAWQTSDSFRQGIAKLGNAIIWVAEGAVNLFIKYLNEWIKRFNVVIGVLQFFGADIKKIGELGEVSFKRLSFASVDAGNKIGQLGEETTDLSASVSDDLNPTFEDLNGTLDKTTTNSEKAEKALKKLKEAAKDAAQAVVDNLEDSLRKAEKALDDVKGKFTDFKNAIGSTITGILNFGDAAESEDFLKGLTDQAVKATAFANKVKQLVVMGLNERAIRQVLEAGFDAGSKIADYIIAGGQTIITQVNQLTDTVAAVADEVGTIGAQNFYQAGIDQGQALVDGIKFALEQARGDLKRVTESLTGGDGGAGGGGAGAQDVPKKTDNGTTLQPGKLLTSTQFAKAANVLKTSGTAAASYTALAYALQNKTVRMAKGGIVTGPTNALIGEAGPEAVIPLSGKNAGGMGSTYNITVNAGIGTDGAVVGRQIVDAIRKYERSSGQVFARV